MKKSDIIDLTFKIIGIYIIVTALLFVKDLHYLRSMFSSNDQFSFDIIALLLFIGSSVLLILLGYLLIFKSYVFTKMIVKEDEQVNLKFGKEYKSILETTLIILGIIILIFRLPAFVSAVIELVKYVLGNISEPSKYFIQNIGYLLQYILGYFLLSNSSGIAMWIININKKNKNID